jgi:hypothetical protein
MTTSDNGFRPKLIVEATQQSSLFFLRKDKISGCKIVVLSQQPNLFGNKLCDV